jgi:hypothetical protein
VFVGLGRGLVFVQTQHEGAAAQRQIGRVAEGVGICECLLDMVALAQQVDGLVVLRVAGVVAAGLGVGPAGEVQYAGALRYRCARWWSSLSQEKSRRFCWNAESCASSNAASKEVMGAPWMAGFPFTGCELLVLCRGEGLEFGGYKRLQQRPCSLHVASVETF